MEARKPTPLKWLQLTADQMKATGEFFIHDLDQLTSKFLTETSHQTQNSDYLVKMVSRRLVKDFEMVADRAISMLQDLKIQMKVEAEESFSSRIQTAKVTRGTSVSSPNLSRNERSISGDVKAVGPQKMEPKRGTTTQDVSASAEDGKPFGIQIKPMTELMSQDAPSDSNDAPTMTSDVKLDSASSSSSSTDSVSNHTEGKGCPERTSTITDEEGNLDEETSAKKTQDGVRKESKDTSPHGEDELSQAEVERILSESRCPTNQKYDAEKLSLLVKKASKNLRETSKRRIEESDGKEEIEKRRSARLLTPTGAPPEGLFGSRLRSAKKIKLEKDSQEWLKE